MIINHNMSSIQSNRMLKIDNANVDANFNKLSSGLRIVSGGDDPSGLAISEKMRSQIRGLNRASMNAADGANFLQTSEGYLGETTQILQRLREVAVQTANGIYTDQDRAQVQVEVSQLVAEVNRIASQAQFNGLKMLTGRFASEAAGGQPSASMWLHVGANMNERLRVYIGTMTSDALGLTANGATSISMSTATRANTSIGTIDEALQRVNKQRADLGAFAQRLKSVVASDDIGAQNLQASESQIRDLNMASEVSDMVKNQILSQSATSVLAQANTRGQAVLRLLG